MLMCQSIPGIESLGRGSSLVVVCFTKHWHKSSRGVPDSRATPPQNAQSIARNRRKPHNAFIPRVDFWASFYSKFFFC